MFNKKRIYYLDVLRALSCIAVIVIHASSNFLIKDIGSINFVVGDIISSLSRFAVPVFLMISGSLLLDEDYTFTEIKNKKHIMKMILFFVFWSFFYDSLFNVFIPLIKGQNLKHIDIFGIFIVGHYHLWFIYLIIGFYLILPLLRLWINKNNIRFIKYFIILAFVFGFLIVSAK